MPAYCYSGDASCASSQAAYYFALIGTTAKEPRVSDIAISCVENTIHSGLIRVLWHVYTTYTGGTVQTPVKLDPASPASGAIIRTGGTPGGNQLIETHGSHPFFFQEPQIQVFDDDAPKLIDGYCFVLSIQNNFNSISASVKYTVHWWE